MASNNVAQFAAELKMPAGVLLEQLQAAGVQKASADDDLSETDKSRLLEHLRKSHGSADADKHNILFPRRHTSEIKQSDSTGKARTIQVEVRKKRVFVKRDESGVEQVVEGANHVDEDEVDEAELQRRDEEARQAAELLEKEALELKERQERFEREEAERLAREEAAEAERRRAEEEEAKRAAAQAEAAEISRAASTARKESPTGPKREKVAGEPVKAEVAAPKADEKAAAKRAAQREGAKRAEGAAR